MKNNFWKKVSIMSTVAMAPILVACGNSSNEGKSNDPVEITYSIWDPSQEDGIKSVVDTFNDENSDIHVNLEITPWEQYWAKLESSAQGGSMPDVFWMHSNEIAKYTEGNVLLDLQEASETEESFNVDDFPEELVDLYIAEDKLLGIPKDYDTIGLWYNKEIFDDAGVEYPDDNWTWDVLLESAIELTDADEGIYGFLAPLNRHEGYHNFIYQNGGEVISDDKTKSGFRKQETIDAVQWYVDLSVKHGVSPSVGQFADSSPIEYFKSGRSAMVLLGSWMTAEIANNEYTNGVADVSIMPEGPQGRATIFNGLANSIAASTDYPEESLRFLEYLSSEEGMITQGKEGAGIPARSGTDVSFIEAYPQFNVEAFIDQMDYRVIKPYTKLTARWEDVENKALIPVFNGEKSVEEVSEDLVNGVEEILASE